MLNSGVYHQRGLPMRGVHDLGGVPAGPIDRSEHERTFFEQRVDAMMVGVSRVLQPGT